MPRKRRFVTIIGWLPAMLQAGPVAAHHAMGGRTPDSLLQGLLSGFAHPLIGPDHLLFLLAAGILVLALKTPERYIAPASLVVAAAAGTVLHLEAGLLPYAEIMIALSVIAGGALVLSRRRLGTTGLVCLLVAAGVLHGYAYGESIIGAEETPLIAYLFGFSLMQYVLVLGVGLVLTRIRNLGHRVFADRAERLAGAAALLTGILVLTWNVA